jgi:hypothetical protein
MAEVQRHGLDFENWIRETFTNNTHTGLMTDKWDIPNPSYKAKFSRYVYTYRGLPVSIKTCKYGSPIGFGDALRQFNNTVDFLLIVGFWLRAGEKKKFVSVKAAKVTHKVWHQLFAQVVTPGELKKDRLTSEEIKMKIERLDLTIKSTPRFQDARKKAKEEKGKLPPMEIVLNPKIDSKNQRRLQCSLPFQTFWTKFAVEPAFQHQKCTFWGEEVPSLK